MAKIPIIMYIFTASFTFSGFYIDYAFGLDLFSGFTQDALEELIIPTIDEEINIILIFGDFIAGLKVVFGILSGIAITDALSSLPNYDSLVWNLIVGIIYTTTSALLWVYIVTGRSL